MKSGKRRAIGLALLAAVFYGINVPVSKLLLEQIDAMVLAGLLYLGAGIGIGILYLCRGRSASRAERLSKKDFPYALGMIVLDDAAPVLLMLGLRSGSSANASLLGNFEIVATAMIALFLFRESVSRRLWFAIALITLSSVILSFEGVGSFAFSRGSLLVLGATACWGLENNCTRSISSKSTYEIVMLKGFFSGAGSLVIGLLRGGRLPAPPHIAAAMALGFVAYGLSIFCYVRAQSILGAAQTSAYYSVSPFVGSFLSFVLLWEPLRLNYLTGLALMLTGAALAVRDTMLRRHSHAHSHTFTHMHNGRVHTHTITHSHEHTHALANGLHTHRHSRAELEKVLRSV